MLSAVTAHVLSEANSTSKIGFLPSSSHLEREDEVHLGGRYALNTANWECFATFLAATLNLHLVVVAEVIPKCKFFSGTHSVKWVGCWGAKVDNAKRLHI